MREIKFRSWDKDLKEMEYWGFHEVGHSIDPDSESTIVMQYTGLKDKNGKEIYEGDIIKWNYKVSSNRDFFAKVVYIIERGEKDIGINMIHCGFCAELSNGTSGELPEMKFTEVVGNIYDNPELLEVV